MYLKSLELSGFKSFAKKTALEFTTPITSIVGPNGSGKSNIAEAFRFVLGEQSIKSMRGKRTEDLIWNGGGDAARANRASVKVVFDNHPVSSAGGNRLLNVDFDEVSLERVIYRDSSSEYFINGTQVRLKDIIELLAGAHIGSSGHHIISQGEADKILNASSRERRDMLEDALGLKIYQYKREESERKLLKTEENMRTVESLRREVAPHLKFLKKQVEKIEHTLVLKEDLRKLSKEYFKREDIYIKHQKKVLEDERRAPTEELKRLEHELNQAKEILSQSEKHDAKSDKLISLQVSMSGVRNAKDASMRELGRIEGAIASEERIIKREKVLETEQGDKPVPLKEVLNIADTVESKIKEIETRRDEAGIVAFFAFIRATFAEFISRHKMSSAGGLRAQSEEELTRLKSERESLEKKLKEHNEQEAFLQKGYNSLQNDIEREKNSSREAERAVFRIMSEENSIRSVLGVISAREEKLNLLEDEFKRDLHDAAMLLGRDVLDFEMFVINDVVEDRKIQEDRKRTIEKMKIRVEDAGAGGGEDVLKEFKDTSEHDAFLEKELADLHFSADSLKKLITELSEKLDHEFREGVSTINEQFGKFFTLMFGGGSVKLAIVREVKRKRSDIDIELALGDDVPAESEAPEEVEEGIEIEVNLPRKKIKGLMMLSGGERALTSIALLFAISQVNPPPFVILDETDAALDEANSKKYGDMIESLSKLSQLILITHNRETMSRAGVLYGVTMGSGGVSKLLSVAFDEAVAVAK